MIIKSRKPPSVETAVIMEWDDDVSTGIAFWRVWYKGVEFGEFNSLAQASERLQKLMDLDSSRDTQRKEENF